VRRFHGVATVAWGGVLALAVLGLWNRRLAFLLGVAFISLCSVYALVVGHWGAFQAAQADAHTPTREDFDRLEAKVDRLLEREAER
jgi:hypothetical protein